MAWDQYGATRGWAMEFSSCAGSVFSGGDFNNAADPAAVKRLMANKKSILDFVAEA